MMKFLTLALAAFFVMSPQPGYSQSAADKTPNPCRDAADENSMLKCHQDIVRAQTKQMDEYRAVLRKRADDDRKFRALFDAAEKVWQQHRDADCKVSTYESANTRSADTYRFACLAKYNKVRIDYLKEMVDSP